MTAPFKFDEVLSINGKKLDKKYIQSLNKQERLDLIEPIFNLLRTSNFIFMDNLTGVKKSWQNVLKHQPDITKDEIYNNSSLGTDICKYFCHSFYHTTNRNQKSMIENFYDDKKLKRIIENRLGLDWLEHDRDKPGVNEAFNLSFKMIAFQGQRSMRFVNQTSIFKPSVAKYMALKYSKENELVGDYSCGFGGRLLGTIAANRRYVGTDPLTTEEIETMASTLVIDKSLYTLIKSGSEDYRGEENCLDLCWSSPPYFDQEYYSTDSSQAYNNGEDFFYEIYWRKTLENCKFMLKPEKFFGLNITDKFPKMVEIAKEYFGEPIETVKLKTVRSHLTKNANNAAVKFEPIWMWLNKK